MMPLANAMTSTLSRRLDRLETAAGVDTNFPVIFVCFRGPDGHELHKATFDGRIWHRSRGETGETFQKRVASDVRVPERPWGTVVFLE